MKSSSDTKTAGRHGSAFVPVLVGLIALHLCLYFVVADQHALNADEGLYATGALRFAEGDILLQKADTDKPPLVYQLQGIFAAAFGKTEMAVKLPNAVANVVLLILVALIGAELFGAWTGLFAVAVIITSPYLGKVSIGAMTDPPATAFLTAAFWAGLRGKDKAAGFFFGMALLTRQMALLYFPLVFAACFFAMKENQKPLRRLWNHARTFGLGLFAPAAYLLIWSAFFEMKRFQWLWQELFSGKVTLGTKQATMGDRGAFWLSQMGDFAFSHWVILVSVGIAAYLYVATRKSRSTGLSRTAKLAAVMMGIGLLYYLLIHMVMGAPLYRRMVLPALPFFAILVSLPFGRFAMRWASKIRPALAFAGWLLLLIGAAAILRVNSLPLLQLQPRDDTPELAQVLSHYPEKQTVLFTTDMNRELMFYLHGSKIKRKQFKGDGQKLFELVRAYPGKVKLLALRRSEMDRMEDFTAPFTGKYTFAPEAETSRGLVRLFRLELDAEIVNKADGAVVATTDGEFTLNANSIRGALLRYLRNTIEAKGEVSIDLEIGDGFPDSTATMDSLTIRADGASMRGVSVSSLLVNYQKPEIAFAELFAQEQLLVRSFESASAQVEVILRDAEKFIAGKNRKNMEGLKVETSGDTVKISGKALVAGMKFDVQLGGRMSLDEKGGVMLHTNQASLGSWNLGGFFQRRIDGYINPTFIVALDELGLVGREVKVLPDRLVFTLR